MPIFEKTQIIHKKFKKIYKNFIFYYQFITEYMIYL